MPKQVYVIRRKADGLYYYSKQKYNKDFYGWDKATLYSTAQSARGTLARIGGRYYTRHGSQPEDCEIVALTIQEPT